MLDLLTKYWHIGVQTLPVVAMLKISYNNLIILGCWRPEDRCVRPPRIDKGCGGPLNLGQTSLWHCDLIGLWMHPLKDVDPELGHGSDQYNILRVIFYWHLLICVFPSNAWTRRRDKPAQLRSTKMALSRQQVLQAHCFQCDFKSCSRQTWSLSFILLRTNSPNMELLEFPSHRALTETNHPSNTNSPRLAHHLQSAQAAPFLFPPSFLVPSLCLHLRSLSPLPPSLLIFPPLALLPASLRHTRVSLSFGSEGWDETQREARKGVEGCNDLSWWTQLERKCWHNEREALRSDGLNNSRRSSDQLSICNKECLYQRNWVIVFEVIILWIIYHLRMIVQW